MAEIGLEISVVATALAGDPQTAARVARAAGFDGLLLDLHLPGLRLDELSGSGIREIRTLLSGHQLKLAGIRADLGPRGFGEGADIDRALSVAERAIRSAADLGATVVSLDIGPLPPARNVPKPKPTITPQQAGLILLPTATEEPATTREARDTPPPVWASQVSAALVELGKRADRFSIPIAFGNSLASFASLNDALAAADCPWFGIDLDPVALLRDPWPVDQVLSTFAQMIHHVRARDAVRGDNGRTSHTPIGSGDVNWDELTSLLRAGDRPPRFTIDPVDLPDPRAAAIAGLNHLRRRTSLP